jgi:hypothetical protein
MVVLAAAISVVAFLPGPARAQQPDYSFCDGLTGAAWGLCRGAIAAGCADDTGDPTACAHIEENYLAVTGEEAPWVVPPALCPCDFSLYPKSATVWDAGAIDFQCPETFAVFRDNLDTEIGTTRSGPSAENPFCQMFDSGLDASPAYLNEPVTLEQFEACRLDIIAYGQQFKASNPGVAINDTCTPGL